MFSVIPCSVKKRDRSLFRTLLKPFNFLEASSRWNNVWSLRFATDRTLPSADVNPEIKSDLSSAAPETLAQEKQLIEYMRLLDLSVMHDELEVQDRQMVNRGFSRKRFQTSF